MLLTQPSGISRMKSRQLPTPSSKHLIPRSSPGITGSIAR
jgi:hypothetical protein